MISKPASRFIISGSLFYLNRASHSIDLDVGFNIESENARRLFPISCHNGFRSLMSLQSALHLLSLVILLFNDAAVNLSFSFRTPSNS